MTTSGMVLNFDASTVEPAKPLEAIPAGWQNMMVVETAEQKTADGTGVMLAIQAKILDGPYAGRVIFERFNLVNANPTAVQIGFEQLSALQHAIGRIRVQHSSELHGVPFRGKVTFRAARTDPATGKDYEASNGIRGFEPLGGAAPGPLGPGMPAPGAFPSPVGTAPLPAAVAAAVAGPGMAGPAFTPPVGAAGFPGAGPAPGIAAPAPPAPVAAPAPPAPFPPAGWQAHPTAAGWFYMGQEVLTEADLRARYAASAVPAAPVAPAIPAAPVAAAAPVAGVAPVVGAGAPMPAWLAGRPAQ